MKRFEVISHEGFRMEVIDADTLDKAIDIASTMPTLGARLGEDFNLFMMDQDAAAEAVTKYNTLTEKIKELMTIVNETEKAKDLIVLEENDITAEIKNVGPVTGPGSAAKIAGMVNRGKVKLWTIEARIQELEAQERSLKKELEKEFRVYDGFGSAEIEISKTALGTVTLSFSEYTKATSVKIQDRCNWEVRLWDELDC